MLSLNEIRRAFDPLIPIRWEIEFSNEAFNIMSGKFPAKEVKYPVLQYKTASVHYAPGLDVEFNVIRVPTNHLEIVFYENSKQAIYDAIVKLNASLNIGQGGLSNYITVTIDEYDNEGTVARTGIYRVQISGEYEKVLQQEASAYSAPLKCLVVGVDKEP